MQDEYVAGLNASEKDHIDKSAEEDPCQNNMEDEKIVVVDAGKDALSVKLEEIKRVQDDVLQEEAVVAGFIAQVEEIKRCMLKKMFLYYWCNTCKVDIKGTIVVHVVVEIILLYNHIVNTFSSYDATVC